MVGVGADRGVRVRPDRDGVSSFFEASGVDCDARTLRLPPRGVLVASSASFGVAAAALLRPRFGVAGSAKSHWIFVNVDSYQTHTCPPMPGELAHLNLILFFSNMEYICSLRLLNIEYSSAKRGIIRTSDELRLFSIQ